MIIREIKTTFSSEVSILDLEISNDITTPSGKWEYYKGDIISCAVFYGEIIICVLREHSDDLDIFKSKLMNILDTLPTCYAFNYLFEKECLKGFLGKDYIVEEIKPFKAKGGSKERFFKELLDDKKVALKDVPEDPLKDNSVEVLNRYAKEDYESIIAHNISDVIKQHFILINSKYLFEKYKDRIDKNGWLQGALI